MERKPPPRSTPSNLAGYLEALSRPVFQAGMNWQVIDAKWSGIRTAFADFDPATVAAFGPDEVERLVEDPKMIRSRAKIEATIDNAQALLELDEEHGGFQRYLSSHASFEDTIADLKRQFRFLGDSGGYYFLYVVNEPVPSHEQWFATRPRTRGRKSRAESPASRRKAPGQA